MGYHLFLNSNIYNKNVKYLGVFKVTNKSQMNEGSYSLLYLHGSQQLILLNMEREDESPKMRIISIKHGMRISFFLVSMYYFIKQCIQDFRSFPLLQKLSISKFQYYNCN